MAEIRAVLAAGPAGTGAVLKPAVVASLTHLGLVARLIAPPLSAALVTGVLPVAPPERVHLRLAGANPIPLALQAPSAVPVAGPADLAAALHRHWLAPAAVPLTRAVRTAGRVSRQVLDGNVSSALASALAMTAAQRPDLAAAAGATLDALLRDGPLAGTGRRREDGSFVRRSCCLFYRLPGAGTCADCILADRPPAGGR
jgi:ferric iron reductase protein FhuF